MDAGEVAAEIEKSEKAQSMAAQYGENKPITDGNYDKSRRAKSPNVSLLREKRPFIWNATDLTKDTRQKLIGLFERYGARVRIVYLETDQETRKARNTGRIDAVPEDAVARMLGKTVLPTLDEAQTVERLCI